MTGINVILMTSLPLAVSDEYVNSLHCGNPGGGAGAKCDDTFSRKAIPGNK
ncbi:hypothetical protein DPMN_015310 [Dreissena polymorpha]|uniref:Uncharacterized protein n=1 Tax=Dreissena polymorpha TaxID=45954 RepID=A0A9D4NB95_DREPO|nr:hypothetical protein DPMN_027605 [Dreissena polymorpha]KAH3891220.1 hypothetical protein DPMN_015310 [Dreissena polymorpha]